MVSPTSNADSSTKVMFVAPAVTGCFSGCTAMFENVVCEIVDDMLPVVLLPVVALLVVPVVPVAVVVVFVCVVDDVNDSVVVKPTPPPHRQQASPAVRPKP
jgi:hypothetical protein